jgi:hypothetical protein
MRSRQEKKSARRYSAPEEVKSIIKQNRIAICRECLKGAVDKNIKAKASPPPENWTAELWLCFRLRRDDKCPQDLPPISC